MANIVIVESPAKTKKISSYLGPNFKVVASVGHFRDLPKKSLGIDIKNNYEATYEITNPKVVSELIKICKNAKTIYLAPDNDREGHGISWHLMEVLKLSFPRAKRMVFNEITKTAIQSALVEADRNGRMDMNAVNSYIARRFVDKITGFKVSPLLWKNINGAKSAGRVQSVATKLVVDKEDEINKHIPEEKYNISGIFQNTKNIYASLKQTPTVHKEAIDVLNLCKEAEFKVSQYETKTVYHSPQPAFKTSVYQQEAGKRYGLSPKEAMRVAQTLYEKGKISYHRTDVTRLSEQFQNEARQYIETKYGKEYLGDLESESKTESKKGEQAAHEAIRPTDVNEIILGDKFDNKEKLIYKMIWIRAVASLMAKEKCNQFSIVISISNTDKYWFIANYLLTIFPGFKILNEDKSSDKSSDSDKNEYIMEIKKNDILVYKIIESKQSYTEPPKRYTESTLVKDLEKKGIGRPSTYANIITTIQSRNYTINQKSVPIKKECLIDTLKDGEIISKKMNVNFGDKKQRLFPTDLGKQTTDFLVSNVGHIMDYNFTSNLENELDNISNGGKNWIDTVDNITTILSDLIDKTPKTPKIGSKLDNVIGNYEDFKIEFFVGKFGPYIKYNNKCYSLPKEHIDKTTVTMDIAISIIKKTSNCLVSYECKIDGEKGTLQGAIGPYGNYLRFIPITGKTINYFLPKNLKDDKEAVQHLTLDECFEYVANATNYKSKKSK